MSRGLPDPLPKTRDNLTAYLDDMTTFILPLVMRSFVNNRFQEYHLQAALAGNGKTAEVPAPPAEESHDIDYDQLYSQTFQKPSSYIRFSQTVEECTGCRYDMSTEDDAFLRSYNEKQPVGFQCSEDAFETVMAVFEATAGEETPFAAVDNTVVPYEVMESPLKQRINQKLLVFAKDIFDHWRTRRQATGNRGLQPSLKFETHQDNDDGDPYVCFRRRDVRQTRKTRARDVQSTDKLRRLRKELEEGRQLVAITNQRELCKRELLAIDRAIFEQRAKVKEAKMRLGIENDDQDLINQRVRSTFHIVLSRPLLTHNSHRRKGRQRLLKCNVRLEDNFVYQQGLMVVQLKQI